ncbi:MAG: hypothetical protein K2X49_02620 [Acetobacteraceae bacterium]|nr:hypothetical protein [Acetobacteraceae bacterium]
MTVDESLRGKWRELQAERAAQNDGLAIEPGGGGGESGGMDGLAERVTRVELGLDGVKDRLGALEGRMDRLEGRMDGLDARLRTVEQSIAAVSAKLDILTTQIVAKLPSWWQMPAVIGATVTLLVALWAAVRWLIARGWM